MELERVHYFREIILKNREDLLRSVTNIDREISGYREAQPAEFNEKGEGQAVINLLSSLDYRQKKELSLMEEALARMQSGTFGLCFRCGNDIPEARLLALPFTTCCKICAVKETSS